MTTDGLSTSQIASAINYDLARIEMLDEHPALADGVDHATAAARHDQLLLDLLQERLPAFDEHLEREAMAPDLAGTRYLEDPEQVALDEIRTVSAEIERLRQRLTYLIAYTREFTPDPPRLADIADAAGVSRTQVTRMYGEREVEVLAEVLNLPSPRTARQALRHRDDVPDLDRQNAPTDPAPASAGLS